LAAIGALAAYTVAAGKLPHWRHVWVMGLGGIL
jgi:hypothetical protein